MSGVRPEATTGGYFGSWYRDCLVRHPYLTMSFSKTLRLDPGGSWVEWMIFCSRELAVLISARTLSEITWPALSCCSESIAPDQRPIAWPDRIAALGGVHREQQDILTVDIHDLPLVRQEFVFLTINDHP